MSGKDQRRFPRADQVLEAHYRADGDPTPTWLMMSVQNISAGGLRFRAEDELDPGRLLRMKIALPGNPVPMEVRGRIVWKQMHAAGVTEHGLEFVDLTEQQRVHIDQLVQFLDSRT